ncbi:MAG: hypothetical protein EA393_16720 [Bacteroidetes bacterium]|nr:MAG: hypothetical protein EA393_16720 [Bacteroidota bacterium]
MNINRENYGAYFLDYYEGNLTQKQVVELMDFLSKHTHLKKEFEAFEMIYLSEEKNITLQDKNVLKKSEDAVPGEQSQDIKMIAYFEGDLDEENSAHLLRTVASNPDLQKDFQLYSNLKLAPDKNVIFPKKSTLRKYPLGAYIPAIQRFAVAAAVIAFLAGIFFMMPRLDDTPEIAQTIPVSEKSEKEEEMASEPEEVKQEETISTPETPAPATRPQQQTIPIRAFSRDIMPQPLEVAEIGPIRTTALTTQGKPEKIEKREEFKGVYFANLLSYEEEMETQRVTDQQQYVTLAGLATTGLERTTGINIEDIQNDISNNRWGFWDIAGAGLAGLSRLTGTPLNVEQERDENGRLSLLAIGERFRVER